MLNTIRNAKNGTTASLSTTASRILAPDNNRGHAIIQNLDNSIVIWIGDVNVAANAGIKLAAGESYDFMGRGSLYAVAASGTPSVGITAETHMANQIKRFAFASVNAGDAATRIAVGDRHRHVAVVQNLSSSAVTIGNQNVTPGSGGVNLAAGAKARFFGTEALYACGPGTNEVQTLTIDATGGTYTLSFGGQTTSALAYNAINTTIQTALRGLSSIGGTNVAVTGSGPFTITFSGTLANTDVALITADSTSLTGNTHTASLVEATHGASGRYAVGVTVQGP